MIEKIHIHNVDLQYRVTGEGQPVILLHGWGCNMNTLQSIETSLAPYFKVYNIDFPGFGDSSIPKEIWGIEEYTRLLEEFIDYQNITDPILLGHSFGGRVTILYSSRNRVRKAILVDAAGIKPKRPLKYYIKIYSFKTYKHLLPFLIGKKKAEEKIEMYRRKAGSSDYNALSGMMRNIFTKIVNEDLTPVLSSIVPVLYVGKNDTATPKRRQLMEKHGRCRSGGFR
ncbi:MAG: alpha/beta fold hydrolase [Barnesiella sp.]